MANQSVLQFKITLLNIKPKIWRCIQLSDQCSFWDLHVAIQDAMGWTDFHLHEFSVTKPETAEKQYIGIPGDDDEEIHPVLPGWHTKVADYVKSDANRKILYLYDFGDHWEHLIEFEGIHEQQQNGVYPRCLAGANACPPEDVGGVPGYEDFVSIIKNPNHEEYDNLLTWVGGNYDPEKFDVAKVKFDDPDKRWHNVFAG